MKAIKAMFTVRVPYPAFESPFSSVLYFDREDSDAIYAHIKERFSPCTILTLSLAHAEISDNRTDIEIIHI